MTAQFMSERNLVICAALLILLLVGVMIGGFALIDAADHRHERNQMDYCFAQPKERVVCVVVGLGR